MKYEKDAEDYRIEKYDLEHNRTLQHMMNANLYKFSVGDVLVCEQKYGNEWKVKTASCGLPYRYVYAFENKLGIGYIRRLSVNGRKFVEAPVCVLHFDPDRVRFQIDPSYADHILLADDVDAFDTKSEYAEQKKKREAMHRKNIKLAEKIESTEDAIKFLKRLKVGDQFWSAWSVRSIEKEPNYVQSIDIKEAPYEDQSKLEWSYNPPGAQSKHWNNYVYKLTVNELKQQVVFLTKPFFFDELT